MSRAFRFAMLSAMAALVAPAVCGACGDPLPTTSGGPSDGGPDDATPGRDGSADDAPAPDGGADARYCTMQDAMYCEDFDTIGKAEELDPEVGGGASTPFLTREIYRSPPRSVVFGIPVGANPGAYTVFKRTYDGTKKVRVELEWRIRSAPAVPGTLQSVTLKRAGGQASFGRTCADDGDGGPVTCSWYVARCATTFCDELIPFPDPPFVNGWGRIFLEARLAKTGGSLAFGVVGAAPVYAKEIQTADGTEQPSDPTSVTVGVAVLQGTSPGIDMVFDDVVVRVE